MAFTQVTLTGVVSIENEIPAAGAVVALTISEVITDGTQIITPQQPILATCNASGAFTVTVNANDDTTTTPVGSYYHVVITLNGQQLQNFPVIVSKANAPTANLFQLAEAPSVVAPYVTTFNTRGGAVTLTKGDVTGTGLAASDVGAAPVGPTVSASPSGGIPAWVPSTVYAINTLVTNGGNDYICLVAHTSGSTFSGESSDWQQLAGGAGGGGVTSASLGFVSLRGDFGLTPCALNASTGTITTQTTAIQSAINSAIAAGKGLDVGADQWAINSALTVTGNLTIRGQGAGEVWGNASNSDQTQIPGAAPWVQGGGFAQTAAATDAIQITGCGVTVHLRDLAIQFYGSAAFNNTGHGIKAVTTTLFNTKPDNGVAGCVWENIVVFGHDGNHYGVYRVNAVYDTLLNIRTYGGGGFYTECNTAFGTDYGNDVFINTYVAMFCSGTANGYTMKSGASSGGTNRLNLISLIRPQCNSIANVSASPLGAAYTMTTPASNSQFLYQDVGTPNIITLYDPDFESGGSSSTVSYGAVTQIMGQRNDPTVFGGPSSAAPTAFGFLSLPLSSTGLNNVAFGQQALQSATSGGNNTAIGAGVLNLNTNGTGNTAVGAGALAANVSNSNNTAVGYQALNANTTDNGTAFGWHALLLNTTGTQNAAFGAAALAGNVTGANNTAMGYTALTVNTASQSTAFGSQALQTATSGGNNTAVGYNALQACSTGATNVAVGSTAASGVSTGSGVTAVGYQAMQSSTDALGNTAVGYQAGKNNVVHGQWNTFLGGLTNATGDFSGVVAIGVDSGGGGASATGNNQFVLGTANHKLFIPGLPTADPHVVGQLWANAHVVTVSAG